MKFTVSWTAQAEKSLVRSWLGARDRISIDEAVVVIEHELATNPMNAGESRFGKFRVMTVEPISVVFSVSPDDRLVKVVQITKRTQRRSSN